MSRELITGEEARKLIEGELGDSGVAVVSDETEDLYEDEEPEADYTYLLMRKYLKLRFQFPWKPHIVTIEECDKFPFSMLHCLITCSSQRCSGI